MADMSIPLVHMLAGVKNTLKVGVLLQKAQHCNILNGLQPATMPTAKHGPADIAAETIPAFIMLARMEELGGHSMNCQAGVIIGKSAEMLMRNMKHCIVIGTWSEVSNQQSLVN